MRLTFRHNVPILILFVACVSLVTVQPVTVFASINYGDMTVEPLSSTLVSQFVAALTKITVDKLIVMKSVSLLLQYTGSDGSQCIKFGIYKDNGSGSPIGEPLVASTHNGYCLRVGTWGPDWETWQLVPSDYLTISTPGVYWLCTLADQAYGTIYHFTYTGVYGGQSYYNYGYSSYSFPVSYALGFPTIPFPSNNLS